MAMATGRRRVLRLGAAAAAAAIAWLAPPAQAMTAMDLVLNCKAEVAPATAYDVGFCLGYMRGFIESATAASGSGQRPAFCAPEAAPVGQIKEIFLKYAADHPQYLHVTAVRIVQQSLVEAFPCPTMRKNLQ